MAYIGIHVHAIPEVSPGPETDDTASDLLCSSEMNHSDVALACRRWRVKCAVVSGSRGSVVDSGIIRQGF